MPVVLYMPVLSGCMPVRYSPAGTILYKLLSRTPNIMIRQSADDFFLNLKANAPDTTVLTPTLRQNFSEFLSEMQEETTNVGDFSVEKVPLAEGAAGYWITLPGVREDRVILFFHGGGFTLGSTSDHLGFCIRLARASGVKIFSVDYRLAPEHPHPAPVNDAMAAFRYLTGKGYHPHHILPAGICAGGNLVLGLLLSLRDKNQPLPLAAVCISPITDILFPGESVDRNAARDWITPARLRSIRSAYLLNSDPALPLVSPVHANLRHLPRLYVQAGTHELLLSDIGKFVEKARWAGVPVQVELFEGMFHSWQLFAEDIPEGDEAIGQIGAFAETILAR